MSRRLIVSTTFVAALGAVAATAVVIGLGLGTASAVAQTASAAVAGEVVKVDKAAGRVTLKHAEIPALDMPPMTMVWRVSDAALLGEVAVGDRVRFVPARVNGQYTVTALSKAAP